MRSPTLQMSGLGQPRRGMKQIGRIRSLRRHSPAATVVCQAAWNLGFGGAAARFSSGQNRSERRKHALKCCKFRRNCLEMMKIGNGDPARI